MGSNTASRSNSAVVREGRTWSTSTANQPTSNQSLLQQGIHPINKLKRNPALNRIKWKTASQDAARSASSVVEDEHLKRRESIYFGKNIRTSMWWLYRRPEEITILDDFMTVENTYRLEPKSGCKFLASKVEDVLQEIIGTHGDYLKKKMAADGAGELVQFLAETIKIRVKSLEFDRYRLIAHIQMGTSSPHDLIIASRCLWNPETDSYVTATIRVGNIFLVLTVYGVFLD
ncbi:dynein light chain Tctex-type protein 2B-like [Amphiura filiformis]|uniref:dynein light chain Tctex-type protein 2B-like n=1 Tax=Amphiura filiformis TaxID=82378 RepID=UPI003B21956B